MVKICPASENFFPTHLLGPTRSLNISNFSIQHVYLDVLFIRITRVMVSSHHQKHYLLRFSGSSEGMKIWKGHQKSPWVASVFVKPPLCWICENRGYGGKRPLASTTLILLASKAKQAIKGLFLVHFTFISRLAL